MARTARFFIHFLLLCTALLATAQPSPRPQKPQQNSPNSGPAVTERYEGVARNAQGQDIPVTIELADTAGTFSGQISSSYGDFPIVGGARNGDTITIEFDIGGEHGVVTARMSDGRLVGTYAAGNESGTLDVKRTSDVPGTGTTSAAFVPTPIVILGVYHMDNPGLDAINTEADDVLTPKRQEEIEELVERLARFRPTKIAFEAPYGETHWPDEYRKYLASQHKMGRNEIEQITFRLAKRMNLSNIYGIDFPMLMNGSTSRESDSPKDSAQARKPEAALSAEEKLLRQSTVTQYLAHLNSASEIRRSQEGYMASLLPVEGTEIYRKADMVANWYQRNLRIFANINRVCEPGTDRVLVIIGAGHLKLLRDFAADSTYFDLVDAESLLN